jgi:L-alanine-DL-glutamate epimerase-like enolase superfamily enzyme
LPAYATGGPSNYPKDTLLAKVEYYLSLGFRGVKLAAGAVEDGEHLFLTGSAAADFEADKARTVRERFGRDLNLMLDGHMDNLAQGAWDLATARAVMKAVEPYDLFFFEEPLPYTDPWGYAELCRATHVPIAGGECLTGMFEWRLFAERDCFDIGQPDGAFTGGLEECVKIATMLESRGRRIAPHCWGAGGALMQNIHLGFAARNACILEIAPAMGPLHREIVGDSFSMQDGAVIAPQAPGLGIQLTPEIKEKFPFAPGSGEFVSVPGKKLDN